MTRDIIMTIDTVSHFHPIFGKLYLQLKLNYSTIICTNLLIDETNTLIIVCRLISILVEALSILMVIKKILKIQQEVKLKKILPKILEYELLNNNNMINFGFNNLI